MVFLWGHHHPTRAERQHAAEQVTLLTQILHRHRRFNQQMDEKAREPNPNVDRHRAFSAPDPDYRPEDLNLCAHGIHVATLEDPYCVHCGELVV